ncbi:MAG: ROK family glucokinase [Nocardioides sp.]
MTLAVGIDVGGTKIAGGVVDGDGELLEEARVDSPARDAEAVADAIAGLINDLASRHEVSTVGVGAAGYIDRARSNVLFAPNIAWRDVPLRAQLEAATALPVVIENDANAAAWGEFTYGAGSDVDDLLLVTVGTGVGGGVVLGGSLLRGAFGVAAEIGHLRMVPNGLLCGCGNRGCLEQYGSGSALVREVREAARAGLAGAVPVLELAGGSAEAITGPIITQAAQGDDPFAIAAIGEIGRWLGEGIASLAAVLDPAMVVIGGGVSAAGDLLLDPIRSAFQASLTGHGHRPTAEITVATLGNRAGIVGAADLGRR